ncbi:MAG: sigma-70 family RNA polymerase sigma factor [Candidatus Doudnabacteria bacterium]|nr:sigma-70 family RNA polymerase sigma factor [Candidatus Doudnabacteria bacterium]
MTEQEVINRIAGGDIEAFGALYDLYLDRIYRFVYYRTHHRETAEDLTSVVFTKAFHKFTSFDRKANFATWIFRIARNTVIDHYRTRKTTSDLEQAFDISDSTNLSRDYELKEKLELAQKYLTQLPEDQRDLVIMRLWDGLSYDEIAEITGKTSANLRVNFSRIMSKMQKEMVLSLILFAGLTKIL